MRTILFLISAGCLLLTTTPPLRAQMGGSFQTAGLSGEGAGPAIAGHLAAPAVQKELNLTAAQIAKVKELRQQLREEADRALAKVSGNQADLLQLSPAERSTRLRELMAKGQEVMQELSATYQPQFVAILKPAQAKRWQQIAWQDAGPAALADLTLADELGLSAEQRDEIDRLQKDFVQRQQQLAESLMASGGPPSPASITQLATLSLEHANALAKVITPEQRTKYDAAIGKKFDVQSLRNQNPGRPTPKGKR